MQAYGLALDRRHEKVKSFHYIRAMAAIESLLRLEGGRFVSREWISSISM